jgi:hypothetical protein
MEKERSQDDKGVTGAAENRKPWQEPKLDFIEPKLTKHGELTEVTGQGFFGSFSPNTF